MLTGTPTALASLHVPVAVGGDLALFKGIIKCLGEAEARAPGQVLDQRFIAKHTNGAEELLKDAATTPWADIEAGAGLSWAAIQAVANIYIQSERTIVCWAMGLTQHMHAVATIQYALNMLLLRGQIGDPWAGACPVRGHSNVQGDRTVGITEKPSTAFLDALERVFRFKAPRAHGLDTVGTIAAMEAKRVKAFFAMGEILYGRRQTPIGPKRRYRGAR